MADEDMSEHEQNLHDLFAGFAMIGLIMRGEQPHDIPTKAYLYADEMLHTRSTPKAGIVSAKVKPKKVKDHD